MLLLGAMAAGTLSAATPEADLEIRVEQLRNERGKISLCLTRQPSHFPNCKSDPTALRLSVPASQSHVLSIPHVAPGIYALALIHDENANGRLDTFARIPREGFGFSRNPQIRMGPPSFSQVRFAVGPGETRQTVRVRYLL